MSVADMFIQAGAKAILSTLIPVDVRRNALLLIRLFAYITEAQNGSSQLKTLDEAWSFVVASNAINEILDASPKLRKWAMTKNRNGKTPFFEFTMVKSKGRLNVAHVYKSTIEILSELAREDDMEEYLNSVLSSTGYFPESAFYQMIGYPENIFLYNETFKQALENL